MKARGRINDINKWANSATIGAKEVGMGWSESRGDGELINFNLVDISDIFVMNT